MSIRPTSPSEYKDVKIEELEDESELAELATTVLMIAALYFTSLWDAN